MSGEDILTLYTSFDREAVYGILQQNCMYTSRKANKMHVIKFVEYT